MNLFKSLVVTFVALGNKKKFIKNCLPQKCNYGTHNRALKVYNRVGR